MEQQENLNAAAGGFTQVGLDARATNVNRRCCLSNNRSAQTGAMGSWFTTEQWQRATRSARIITPKMRRCPAQDAARALKTNSHLLERELQRQAMASCKLCNKLCAAQDQQALIDALTDSPTTCRAGRGA